MQPNKDFNKTSKPKPKKKIKLLYKVIGGVVGLLISFIAAIFLWPNFGSINYGVCKTFIELQEPYPQSIQYINAYEDPYTNSAIISYKKIDPFGLEALNEIQCFFAVDENGNALPYEKTKLLKVDINGKKRTYPQEAKEIVDRFNVGISGILDNSPSLVMPYVTSNDIKDYR